MSSATARLPRWPTANPSEMTAAIEANTGGSSYLRIRVASIHAALAATAVCKICHHTFRTCTKPVRKW
jgi:hypothetical protein